MPNMEQNKQKGKHMSTSQHYEKKRKENVYSQSITL